MINTYITQALSSLCSNEVYWELPEDGTQYSDILWRALNGGDQPTETEITAEVTRLQAEYDANAYARSRKTKYDALNQLELISDDAINGTTTHADAILAIKAEIPKPV